MISLSIAYALDQIFNCQASWGTMGPKRGKGAQSGKDLIREGEEEGGMGEWGGYSPPRWGLIGDDQWLIDDW